MTNQQENDLLMESFINRVYFKKKEDLESENIVPSIEFYVNTTCDLKCSYCYIHNHRKELYPVEYHKSEYILKNAEAVLKYIIDNEYVCNLELFSGELFSQELGFNLLDLILTYGKKKPNIIRAIMIPSNMNFIADKARVRRIEKYLHDFYMAGIRMHISASVDGPYLSQNRSFVSEKEIRDDEFYNDLFKFVKRHGCGLHPMVSSVGIEKWIKTYDWFTEMIQKYDIKDRWGNYIDPMMLEVRNNDWTDGSIAELLKFYDHLFDKLIEKYGSKENFVRMLYDRNYGPEKIQYCNVEYTYDDCKNRKISCAIQKTLHIRLGDLAIVNCHRLSYEELILGKFKVDEDNNIVGINAINPSLLLVKNSVQSTMLPKCAECKYSHVCMKGCLGAQYEHNSDMFYPIPGVCKMLTAKYDHLTKRYYELDLFKYMFNYLTPTQKEYYNQLIKEMEKANE